MSSINKTKIKQLLAFCRFDPKDDPVWGSPMSELSEDYHREHAGVLLRELPITPDALCEPKTRAIIRHVVLWYLKSEIRRNKYSWNSTMKSELTKFESKLETKAETKKSETEPPTQENGC